MMKITRIIDEPTLQRLQAAVIAQAQNTIAAEIAVRDAAIADLQRRLAAAEGVIAKLKGALS